MVMLGIDVSNWQSGLNMAAAKAQGVKFAIIKSSEGMSVDRTCDTHYQNAKNNGILRGVYHFARPDLNDPIAEADYWVNNIKGYIHDALLVLDWERNETNVTWAKSFLDRVYARTGVRPVIYMNVSAANGANWNSVINDYALWCAGYPGNAHYSDQMKFPYSLRYKWNVIIWQLSNSGSIGGKRPVDLNIAWMTEDQWNKYANPGITVNPAPAPNPAPRYPILEIGSTGTEVRKLQQNMNRVFPAYSKLVVDGIFGNATANVVKEFQRRAGLTPDGIVGPLTRAALARYGAGL